MSENTTDNTGSVFIPMADVKDEPKEYVYNPYIPRGKLTGGSGDPGVGKSKCIEGIAAKVTKGEPLLGIPCDTPGNVLLFSVEDDASDIKQTLVSCGADLSKVFTLSEEDSVLRALGQSHLTFKSEIIEDAVKRFKPVMVVFDPLQAYVGPDVNPNDSVQMEAALAPIKSLAKRFNFAAVLVQHNNKMKDNTSLQARAAGTASLVGNYRSLLSIVRDPENPDENIVIHSKTNNKRGKSIRYKIESIPGNEDFATVNFMGLEDYTERDYRKAEKRANQEREEHPIENTDIAVSTICKLLEENPKGLCIGKLDLERAAGLYFDKYLGMSLSGVAKKYGGHLKEKLGISFEQGSDTILQCYTIKGTTYSPCRSKDRCVRISYAKATKNA